MFGKILFITSPYGGLPRGISNTLNRMGVDYIQTPIWNMEEFYEKFNPQVVIFFHHFLKEWNQDTIDRIEKVICHKIYWDWECPWEIDYLRKYHHFFSKVLIQDKSSVEALKADNPHKFIHVPHAADKDLANAIDIPFEYRSDLCFIGAAYASRLKFMREILPHLKDYKVIIGGTGWEFLPDITGQKIINIGVNHEDYIMYSKGAKVCLNLHRLSQEMPIANDGMIKASSPNNRFFELNMMGCAQVVDDVRIPELNEYYPVNIACHTTEEFLAQIKAWIADDENRKKYAKQMQEYSLEHNTYENRFTEIIAKII